MNNYILSVEQVQSKIVFQLFIQYQKTIKEISVNNFSEIKKYYKNKRKPINLSLLFNLDFHWHKKIILPYKLKKHRLKQWLFQINEEFPNALKSHLCLRQIERKVIISHFYNLEKISSIVRKSKSLFNEIGINANLKKIVILPWGIMKVVNKSKPYILINLKKNSGWLISFYHDRIDLFIPFSYGLASSYEQISKVLLKILYHHTILLQKGLLVVNFDNSNEKDFSNIELIKQLLSVFPNVSYWQKSYLELALFDFKIKNIIEKEIRRIYHETIF